ncbi:MAG TPA: DUF1992 domain-containing protein [Vicinamibacterales bacterium]|nr:DUF1992 domain-containing protein [Vicinamibacterales bacterium]
MQGGKGWKGRKGWQGVAAFERIAELRIREAIAEGKFDRLPNRGRPIDLDWYFALPEGLRLGYGLLKSNDCAPLEVDLLREIAEMEEKLTAADANEPRALARRIRDWRIRLHLLIERQRRDR